jgi:hypothetical protein
MVALFDFVMAGPIGRVVAGPGDCCMAGPTDCVIAGLGPATHDTRSCGQ